MYQWCEFKSRRGKNKNLTVLKSNSNTVWFNFQTYIHIYTLGSIPLQHWGHRVRGHMIVGLTTMQSVPITTNAVSLNPAWARGTQYNIM